MRGPHVPGHQAQTDPHTAVSAAIKDPLNDAIVTGDARKKRSGLVMIAWRLEHLATLHRETPTASRTLPTVSFR
jgi:hypothetical protein